jgi:methyl-accepting chemotaxis protein
LYQASLAVYEALPHTGEEAELWKQFKPAMEAWREANQTYFAAVKELEATEIVNPMALRRDMEQFQGDHHRLMAQTLDMIVTTKTFDGGADPKACHFGRWLEGHKFTNPAIAKALEEVGAHHDAFHHAVPKIRGMVASMEMENAVATFQQTMKPAAQGVFAGFEAILGEAARAEGLYGRMNTLAMEEVVAKQRVALDLLDRVIQTNEAGAEKALEESLHEAGVSRALTMTGMLVGFGAALALGLFLSLSITRALKGIIAGLSEGAQQVASAAGQVSGSSQSLAEGASEQAASIEETSSSLEEMSSMTRQNADNARQADGLVTQTRQIVEKASGSMRQLTAAMDQIATASTETSKIIKTIDEIAFQTNLLALNAAVEAARAGEAGAGFAVVADEVRSLALRAAEAAKNTAGLIEGTVGRVKEGVEVVASASQAFEEVTSGTGRVAALVAEIAAASGEQAQGIGQVNTAVSEMDKVTQQNAANAEESASASEELSAQAEQMQGMVDRLVRLVEGRSAARSAAEAVLAPPPAAVRSRRKTRPSARTTPSAAPAAEAIPLEEDELSRF